MSFSSSCRVSVKDFDRVRKHQDFRNKFRERCINKIKLKREKQLAERRGVQHTFGLTNLVRSGDELAGSRQLVKG